MLGVNFLPSIQSLQGSAVLSGFKGLGDKAVVHEYICCRKGNVSEQLIQNEVIT